MPSGDGPAAVAGICSVVVPGDPPKTTEYVEAEVLDPGRPCVEVVRGAPFQKPFVLQVGSVIVGRDPACELAFDVTGVSRKHARLVSGADGEAEVVDLDSRNGTFVNGRRVERAVLRDGDEIRFGQAVVKLRYIGRVGPPSATSNPDASPTRPPDLSPREFEVARLVAEGMTNAEIGKQLSISPATVGRHLSNVYERLDIHSRAALARYVTNPRSGGSR